MPNGRFVSRSISTNEQLGRVSLNAFTLFETCIPHLDVSGRLPGNPTLVKSIVLPLRPEITETEIELLLAELSQAAGPEGDPLVRWYEVKGTKVLEFPGFDRQQQGLNKKREAASRLPSHNHPQARSVGEQTELLQEVGINSGLAPESVPELVQHGRGSTPAKLSEVKSREVQVQVKNSTTTHWLAPFLDIWKVHMGAYPTNPALLGKLLKPVCSIGDASLMLGRWERFVLGVSKNPQFYGGEGKAFHKFAGTPALYDDPDWWMTPQEKRDVERLTEGL